MGTKVNVIGKNTFMLTDRLIRVNQFLLVGEESALLIDTGYGGKGFASALKKLAPPRLFVANSHLHPDHSNGNSLFERIYVGEADMPEKGMPSNALALAVAEHYEKYSHVPKALIKKILSYGLITPGKEKYAPVSARFSLGGRTIETLACPGHTPGSTLFADRESGDLFVGDAVNGAFWAFTDPSLTLSGYAEVLKGLLPRLDGCKRLWISHSVKPLDIGYIEAFIETLLDVKPEEGKPVGIEGTGEKVCIFKRYTRTFGDIGIWAFRSQVR